jgi:hypothetical protein
LLVMAWSPPALKRRDCLGFSTRRLRHLQFQPHLGRHRLIYPAGSPLLPLKGSAMLKGRSHHRGDPIRLAVCQFTESLALAVPIGDAHHHVLCGAKRHCRSRRRPCQKRWPTEGLVRPPSPLRSINPGTAIAPIPCRH